MAWIFAAQVDPFCEIIARGCQISEWPCNHVHSSMLQQADACIAEHL